MKPLLLPALLHCILALRLISVYKHDPDCYTQGLFFLNSSTLLQSCGHYAQSRIRQLSFNQMLSQYEKEPDHFLPREVFGEGITMFKGKIYVLTWRQKKVFVFDKELKNKEELPWKRQGWGITHNDTHLFISDGSSTIYVVDQQLAVLQEIKVTYNQKPLNSLNELEFYKGNILANIYFDENIAQIDPLTGAAKLHNFKSIVSQELKNNPTAEVLNGIAFEAEGQKLLVTGKYWKFMYEVQID